MSFFGVLGKKAIITEAKATQEAILESVIEEEGEFWKLDNQTS